MFNQGGSPSLINLTFIGNSANYGGGIYNIDHSNPALIDVIFNGNQAGGGGGMSNVNSNPMLTNVTFSGNSAGYCGGMFNSGSSPVLISVTFSGNISSGMCNWDASDSSLTNVSFSGNSAEAGGGMNNVQSSPILTNVTFSGNSAEAQGGGMYCEGGSPTLKDVTFFGNTAGYGGGGMHNTNNSPTLTNVTFSGNDAGDYGGGMSNWSSSPTLTNVTFSGNEAQDGGGMVNGGSSLTIANTILWGNTAGASGPQIYNDETSATSIQYSDVQGGCAAIPGNDCSSGGNIDADPQFVRNPHPGPDATWGTEDDDYGDLRLMYDSPTIDAGDNTAPGLAGIITDLGGNPRFYDVPGIAGTGVGPPPLVDMGAYEKQANDAPATGYDSYTTKVDVPLNVSAPGILTNDRDPDGELISAMLKSRPSSGSLSLNPDGSFEYLPETVFSGVVTFTYYATDGLLDSYSATVTIDVELYEVFLPLINH